MAASSKCADPNNVALNIYKECPNFSERDFFDRKEVQNLPDEARRTAWETYDSIVKAKTGKDLEIFDNKILPPKHFGYGIEGDVAYHGSFVGDDKKNPEPILIFNDRTWLREAMFDTKDFRFSGYPEYSCEVEKYYWDRQWSKLWLLGEKNTPTIQEIYPEVKKYVKKYVYHPDEAVYDVVACYILATHVWTAFDAFPRLISHAPSNSGKTQLIRSVRNLCFKPTSTGDATKSSLTRTADTSWGVMIFDNFDKLPQEQKEGIIHFLEVSYQGDLGTMRTDKVGNKYVQVRFGVGVPVVMGTTDIGAFSEAAKNRAISIAMEQAPVGKYAELPAESPTQDSNELRNSLYAWGITNVVKAKKEVSEIDTGMTARDAQIAKPLLYVASLVGTSVVEAVKDWLTSSFRTYHGMDETDDRSQILEILWKNVKDEKGATIKVVLKDITIGLLSDMGISQVIKYGKEEDDVKPNPAFHTNLLRYSKRVASVCRDIPQTRQGGTHGQTTFELRRSRVMAFLSRYGILTKEELDAYKKEMQTTIGGSNEN